MIVRIHLGDCLGNLSSNGGCLLAVGLGLVGDVGFLIGLVGAVDGNLDSDLTTLNLLAVHLVDSLLLQLLRSKSDEAEATTLAGLTSSLELLDHESRNRSESDLSRRRLVGLEKVLEL